MGLDSKFEMQPTIEAVLRDKDGNIKQVWAEAKPGETPEQAQLRVIFANQLPDQEEK